MIPLELMLTAAASLIVALALGQARRSAEKARQRQRALYKDFAVGASVAIVDRATLEQFRRDWHWHHPLDVNRLSFAGTLTRVTSVFIYHGGDELYELQGVPGLWHKDCLVSVE